MTQASVGGGDGGDGVGGPVDGRSGLRSEPAYPATYISWEAAQEFIARLNDERSDPYVSLANRSRVGVCLPSGDADAVVVW